MCVYDSTFIFQFLFLIARFAFFCLKHVSYVVSNNEEKRQYKAPYKKMDRAQIKQIELSPHFHFTEFFPKPIF